MRELRGRESSALRVNSVWMWVPTELYRPGLEEECCVACDSVVWVSDLCFSVLELGFA